jgi:hypothetical protein
MALHRIGMVFAIFEHGCRAGVHPARRTGAEVLGAFRPFRPRPRSSVGQPARRPTTDSGAILGAARLLADARCRRDLLDTAARAAWSVSSAIASCGREITTSTGIAATTSSLALLDQFESTDVRRFAMVTLNPPEMNRTIKAHFAAAGYELRGRHRAHRHRRQFRDGGGRPRTRSAPWPSPALPAARHDPMR